MDGKLDGFIFKKGDFTDVSVPGGSGGALNDVNDLGQAVGAFDDVDTGVVHSYLRSNNGEITVLPDAAPAAYLTEATGVNNAGVIVGFFIDANESYHGFVLRGGKYTTYDYPGATQTILTRINDRGQIVGIWADADGRKFVASGCKLRGSQRRMVIIQRLPAAVGLCPNRSWSRSSSLTAS